MGNNKASKRVSARRAATFLAAIGALVMSSGIAMMVAATPAHAAAEIHKSYVCKYVNKPGGGTELAQTGQNPIYVDNHSIAGKDTVSVGDKFTDKHGYSIVIVANTPQLDPEPSVEDCGPAPEVGVANADAVPNTPTCENNVASYTVTEAEGVETPFAESAPPAFDTTITLTATASSGFEFPGGEPTKEISVTFPSAATGCTEVNPPEFCPEDATANAGLEIPEGQTAEEYCTADTVVSPPTVVSTPTKTKSNATVTPTVVHAGLAGATVQDMRAEQGLALVFGGMVMMVAAGGLGLRLRGSAARI